MSHSNKCYLCHKVLDNSNSSKEHVIPNALGGKLTARILCHDCNNKLGSSCDAKLAEALKFFAYKVNHSRSYGKVQEIELKLNGHTVKAIPGGGFKACHPIIKISDKQIHIEAYGDDVENITENTLLNLLKKKKINSIQYDALKEQITKHIKVVDHPLIEGEIQFKNVWIGLIKIAINYAVSQGVSYSELEEVIDLLLSNDELKTIPFVNLYYSDNAFPEVKGSICHIIHLIGDAKTKSLYCFISLYGVLQSIVLLSTRYRGESFSSSYAYDVWNDKEVTVSSPPLLTLKDLNKAFKKKNFREEQKNAIGKFINFFVIDEKILSELEKFVEKKKKEMENEN